MENINKKRIYSFLADSIISNLIGFFIFSLFNLEKLIKVSSFIIFNQKFIYGYSFQLVFIIIYFIIFDILNNGKTLGKLIFSINIVDKVNKKQLSRSRLLERTFYKTIAIIILPISIVLFIVKDGYTIQDKFSKTTTVI